MKLENKLKRISTLRYIIASRWFLHACIVILGIIQKVIGVADFDPKIFLLILITYSYNLSYYLYLRRDPVKITERGLKIISVLQVVVDKLVYTVILYNTGGVESLSFLFYFLTIFIAILLFRELQIIMLSMFTVVLYVSVLSLEYLGTIPHIYRYHFDPGLYQNIGVTVHNGATVVLILIFTAFFAAFISSIIKSREESITSERDKVSSILDNLVDGVIMLDVNRRIRLMNPYAQRILHLEKKVYHNQLLDVDTFPTTLKKLIKYINKSCEEPN